MSERYEPPIQRKDTAKGHHYVDGNQQRVPGVTTIIGDGLPKPALINWSANATAEAAIDQWDELADMPPSKRLEQMKKARFNDRDTAAKRGTEVHAIAERLIKGEQVDVPDELAGHVESYVQFLDAFEPDPIHVEFGVASYKHGYAGTGDLIAHFPTLDMTLLCDIKTNRSGVFGETALQLAAYCYADELMDIPTGTRGSYPHIDGCAVIHVRSDGYDLVPITTGQQQFRDFLYVQRVAWFQKHSRDLIGAPIDQPHRTRRYIPAVQ